MFRYTLLSKSKSSVYLSLQNATNQVIDHLGHLSGAVYFFAAHPLTQGAETAVRGEASAKRASGEPPRSR
jgi:hypothetical protein